MRSRHVCDIDDDMVSMTSAEMLGGEEEGRARGESDRRFKQSHLIRSERYEMRFDVEFS